MMSNYNNNSNSNVQIMLNGFRDEAGKLERV